MQGLVQILSGARSTAASITKRPEFRRANKKGRA
jgi:hypothetical protein